MTDNFIRRRNFIKGIAAIGGQAALGASIFLGGTVKAATSQGIPNIFYKKDISPQLFNAASALWLGNYAQYADTVSPIPIKAIRKVITGKGIARNGESMEVYRIPLQDWYTEPAAWFLMNKYQQVVENGRGNLTKKIKGFSKSKFKREHHMMYNFYAGLNRFLHAYLNNGGYDAKMTEQALVKSIFQAGYENESTALKLAQEYLSNKDMSSRTRLIVEVKNRLLQMKDKQRPYIALCGATILSNAYVKFVNDINDTNSLNLYNNLEMPLRGEMKIKVRGEPHYFSSKTI